MLADELPLVIDALNALQCEYVKSRSMLHAMDAQRNALGMPAHFHGEQHGTQHGEHVPQLPKRSVRAAQLAAMKNSPVTQPKRTRYAAQLAARKNSPVWCELQQDIKADVSDLNTSSSPKFAHLHKKSLKSRQ